ncbi:MAG: hypothetical protein H6512_11740 [Acidimicrobiia bacterium]|nr:hypothetical protein [Acidimicrobiia bacterium]
MRWSGDHRLRRGDDDGNVSDPATITVTVQAPLVPPVAVDDDAVTEPGVPVGIDVVGNDSDSDGVIDPTTVMLIDPVTRSRLLPRWLFLVKEPMRLIRSPVR